MPQAHDQTLFWHQEWVCLVPYILSKILPVSSGNIIILNIIIMALKHYHVIEALCASMSEAATFSADLGGSSKLQPLLM